MEKKGKDLLLDNSAGANSALSNEILAAAAASQTNSSLANSGKETAPPDRSQLEAIGHDGAQGAQGAPGTQATGAGFRS